MGCGFRKVETRPATQEEIDSLETAEDVVWERMNAHPLTQPSSLGTIFDADLADIWTGPEFDRRIEFFTSRDIDPTHVSNTAWVGRRDDDGRAIVRFAVELIKEVDGESHVMHLCYHDGEPHSAFGIEWIVCEWSEIAR